MMTDELRKSVEAAGVSGETIEDIVTWATLFSAAIAKFRRVLEQRLHNPAGPPVTWPTIYSGLSLHLVQAGIDAKTATLVTTVASAMVSMHEQFVQHPQIEVVKTDIEQFLREKGLAATSEELGEADETDQPDIIKN